MSKRLAKLKEEINKKYKGNYVVLASDPSAFEIQKLPTGVFALDVVSYGGVPKGRISILWGAYSSGKTSAALSLVGRAQRTCRDCSAFMQITGVENSIIDEESGEVIVAHADYDENVKKLKGLETYRGLSADGALPKKDEDKFAELTKWFNASSLKDKTIRQVAEKKYLCPECGKDEPMTAVWMDVEGVFDRKWASNFHVDLESLWVVRPTYAEQVVDITDHIIRSGECDLIILDSVAAMVPTKEIEDSVSGDSWVTVLRRSDDKVSVTTVAELEKVFSEAKASKGKYDQFLVRGLGRADGFCWSPVRKVWKHKRRKRMFEIRTKYGRRLKVTEDHSLFKIVGRRRRDKKRKMDVVDGQLVEVMGSEIRPGDFLLMEDKITFPLTGETVDVTGFVPEDRSPKNRMYVAHPAFGWWSYRLPETRKNGWNLRNAKYGPALPLSVARRHDIEVPGDSWVYTTGRAAACRASIRVERLAYLVGQFIGDGYLTGSGKARTGIKICVGLHGAEVLSRLRQDLDGLVLPGPRLRKRDGGNDSWVEIGCKPLAAVFKEWFGGQRAHTKRMPSEVFGWPASVIRSVLQGVIDSDGLPGFSSVIGKRVDICTTSYGLVQDLVQLLKALGVIASIQPGTKAGTRSKVRRPDGLCREIVARHDGWHVVFSGSALEGVNGGKHGRREPSVLTDFGYPVKVLSVREVPSEETYDIEVIGRPTFVVNDILVHNSAEKFQQGLSARIMNKAIRTWVSGISEAETSEADTTMPTIVLINQVRQKIGVMYGCFSHRTRVVMGDGTTRRISELVKSRSEGPVLSFDPKSGEIQPRKIVGWHQNGKADKFLTIRTTAPNACGYCTFDVTPDHKVYKVGDGDMVYEVGAGQLAVGDEMISGQGRDSDGIPEKKTRTTKVKVKSIEERTQLGCTMQRYDLEIEENHTYMVGGPGGVAVHNSPDVMPGGKGQEFGNSLTIKLHGSKYAFEEDSGMTWSRVIKATVTKSKVSPPREVAEYVLWLRDKEPHTAGSTEEPKVIMQQAMKEGIITKEKTTYFMAGEKYKTQKEMMTCLMGDDMLLEKIRSTTLTAMCARKLRSAP